MSQDQVPYGNHEKPKKPRKTLKKEPEKPHNVSDIEREKLKLIAGKARKLRIAKKISYEEFARISDINRNTYFRFEKSVDTGENYTMAVLLKVIRGLNISVSDFFQDIK